MTKEDLEEASGGGDREDWFGEGGCPKSCKMERQSASNCRRNGGKSVKQFCRKRKVVLSLFSLWRYLQS